MRFNPGADVAEAITKIRQQMKINITYFRAPDRVTLDILQGHIEDQLKEIEFHLKEDTE